MSNPTTTGEWTAEDFELLCASDAELRAKQVNERYRRLLHDWTVLEQEVADEREKRKEDSIIYEKLADALDAKCQTLGDALKELHDDIAEYAAINHLGGFQNHAMKKARAALEKAKEGSN